MTKFKGFTLSEVLIAMLVLGIIVSASVPVILKLAPNKNVAMIKKAYYTTETVVNGLINDQYYYPDSSVHCQGGQASGANNTTTGGTCYYGFDDPTQVYVDSSIQTVANANTKFRCLFASKLNIKESLANVCNGSLTRVTTMDGMTWELSLISTINTNDNSSIQIDVDGVGNGVHAYSKTGNKGLCASDENWAASVCNADLTARTKKNFDRIEIHIARNGKLEIKNNQQDFIDIVSGKKKVISGDDD